MGLGAGRALLGAAGGRRHSAPENVGSGARRGGQRGGGVAVLAWAPPQVDRWGGLEGGGKVLKLS